MHLSRCVAPTHVSGQRPPYNTATTALCTEAQQAPYPVLAVIHP